MDRASSLIYPGSRTLAGWWRQLAGCQPQALWVGYAFVHRIEVAVQTLAAAPLEPVVALILQALDLEETARGPDAAVHLGDLEARLHLPLAILRRTLHDLEAAHLVAVQSAGGWRMTESGRNAVTHRAYTRPMRERRSLPFLECVDPAGVRLGPPQFVPLAECLGTSWPVDPAHRFDPALLEECINESAAWKTSRNFPRDLVRVARGESADAWQEVIIDRAERVMLALVLAGKDPERLLGFAVKVDGWMLHDAAPVLQLDAEARRFWPGLDSEIPAAVFHDAWRGWCRERQLPANEVEISSVRYASPRLVVQPPPRLLQRLQASRSDLFKGDAWILVGDGYFRAAVQLAVGSGQSS